MLQCDKGAIGQSGVTCLLHQQLWWLIQSLVCQAERAAVDANALPRLHILQESPVLELCCD